MYPSSSSYCRNKNKKKHYPAQFSLVFKGKTSRHHQEIQEEVCDVDADTGDMRCYLGWHNNFIDLDASVVANATLRVLQLTATRSVPLTTHSCAVAKRLLALLQTTPHLDPLEARWQALYATLGEQVTLGALNTPERRKALLAYLAQGDITQLDALRQQLIE